MRHLSRVCGPLLLTLVSAACSSLPEVESRLQMLQFYPNMYVVQAGDTLETVAFRYELSTAELAALNPGAESRFYPGLRINVRPGTELADELRARTGWAPTSQPKLVSADAPRPQAAIVSATVSSNLPVRRLNPEVDEVLAGAGLGPGRMTNSAGEAGSFPREEIIEDDLDAFDVSSQRERIDNQLQRYVGSWSWPLEGQIARGYAPNQAGGQGVDIAGIPGQDVRAAKDGTVVYSGRDLSGGGNLIIVRHDDSLMTTYSHADSLFVAEDDVVQAGDPIASLGWNSNQESVLRFEVRQDGNPLNPMDFLPPK